MQGDQSDWRDHVVASARALAWWCVVAVVALIPAVTLNPTILGIGTYPLTVDQVELPKTVLFVVITWLGIASWGLAELLEPLGIRWRRAWLLLVGFLGLATVSAIASAYPQVTYTGRWFHYEGLITWWTYGSIFFLTAQVMTPGRLTAVTRAGAITGGLLSLYGLAQALGYDPANWLTANVSLTRSFSTWNNPDFFGGYLLFPLAFSIALMTSDPSKRWRALGGMVFAAVVGALVATLTRGAWLLGALAGGLMLVVLARQGRAWRRGLALASVLVALAVVVISVTSGGDLAERAAGVFEPGTIGAGARVELWQRTLPHSLRFPLLGAGPDSFQLALLDVAGGPTTIPDDPHSVVLHLLVTVGVPATAALCSLVVLVLVISGHRVFSRAGNPRAVAAASMWSAAAAYGVYLLLNVSIVASTALLFLCLGALSAFSAPRTVTPPAVPKVASILGVLMVILATWLGAHGIAADHAYLQARRAAREGGDRVTWATRAVELNPLVYQYANELTMARAQQGQE